MKPELTSGQQRAVTDRGGARLVSAAAGSGKTFVLVERLMRYVEEGVNIDRFLVITYTRAAASELRSRILSALADRLAKEPQNKHLRRQTELCCRADIGTIDSICGRFLRENTHLIGIAPDYKVIEPERSETLMRATLEKLLEERYTTIGSDTGFAALADSFGAGRDDTKLVELTLRLYAALQSHPDPEEWIREQRRSLVVPVGTDMNETPWGRLLLTNAAEDAEYWAKRLDTLLRELALPEHAALCRAYGESLAVTAEGVRNMARAARLSWEAARLASSAIDFPRARPFRGEDALMSSVAAVRDEVKKRCGEWRHGFADTSEMLHREMELTRGASDALLVLVSDLSRAFAAEKKRQGLVDFSDQEHMVLRLLEDRENGLADALSRRYTEVLVDEYQDVNECQDRLFTLLSDGGRKLFLVGDVKQSIYRFRLADPTIFLDKYNRWKNAEDAAPGEPGRILLRENFRSRCEVLESVNHVFGNIMSTELGELDYDDDAALRPGPKPIEGEGVPTEMTVLTVPEGEDTEGADKQRLEADWIAARIRSLVESGTLVRDKDALRPAEWGDFAILLRSHKAAAPRYRAALAAQGIPSVSQQGGGFFRSLEVSVLLSLLAVIDNPRQDVPLIAALRSPLLGFTPDELSAIRAFDKNSDFYTALCLARETMPRVRNFLDTLEEYRTLAADLSTEELLNRIADRTELYALLTAMPDGAVRRGNVQHLLDYARQFEHEGYRGLFRFLEWMKHLEERGEEPKSGAAETQRAVQIISIHHSKGLEYSIVFLAGTEHRFNKADARETVLLHPKLGIGTKVIDAKRGITYPSLAWRALSAEIDRENLSEEMRVLYVAMTRAKDRLFITCLVNDAEKLLDSLREGLTSPIDPALLQRDASPARWLLRTALLPDSPITLRVAEAGAKCANTVTEVPAAGNTAESGEGEAPTLTLRLRWQYEHAAAAELPSKLTASALEGTEEEDREAYSLAPRGGKHRARAVELGREAAPLTGTEKGIAAHTVMQFMDFSRGGSAESVKEEIARLCAEGHLTAAQAAAVDADTICAFFRSPIGRRVLHADETWRELRFSLLAAAEDYFPVPSGEQVLLQGVADCCIREGDALTVVDYKTDRVTKDTLAEKAKLYAPQLRVYAAALERVLGLPVREGVLYFLRSGDAVNIPISRK